MSLEWSPVSAAPGSRGFGWAAAGFSDSRDVEDGTAVDTVHCSQFWQM